MLNDHKLSAEHKSEYAYVSMVTFSYMYKWNILKEGWINKTELEKYSYTTIYM